MSLVLIQTVTVGAGGAASIEFTGIPQDGTDLVLMLSLKDTNGSDFLPVIIVNVNGASPTFTQRYLRGVGGTVNSALETGNLIWLSYNGSSTGSANSFGNASLYLPNYTSTSNKTISIDGSLAINNSTGGVNLIDAVSIPSSAGITALQIVSNYVAFAQHSTASLYKITKA